MGSCLILQTAFLETSPYLLALTIVVSILHSVFEFLAFKNGRFLEDIYGSSYWSFDGAFQLQFPYSLNASPLDNIDHVEKKKLTVSLAFYYELLCQ